MIPQMMIMITPNLIFIRYHTTTINIYQRQNAWERIRPLVLQALDGLGLDFTGWTRVTFCHIDHLGNQWHLLLENQRQTLGTPLGAPESQAFRDSLVSYLTHPDILGFTPEPGQFSPVQVHEDLLRLLGEIKDALQSTKEASGDGPKLPPGHY